jgi:hypothetical protein
VVSYCSFGFYCVVGKEEKRNYDKYYFILFLLPRLFFFIFPSKIHVYFVFLHEKVGKELWYESILSVWERERLRGLELRTGAHPRELGAQTPYLPKINGYFFKSTLFLEKGNEEEEGRGGRKKENELSLHFLAGFITVIKVPSFQRGW